MKVELGIGVLMITCLGFAIGSCEKADANKLEEEVAVSDYSLVADSIRVDSTIENKEIIALACEELFDRKYIGEKTTVKLSKKFMIEQISVKPFNGNTLVQIDYEYWGDIQQHKTGVYLLDSSRTILSKGMIDGAWYRSPELTLVDWNNDNILEIKDNHECPVRPPDIVEQFERIYSFDQDSGLQMKFDLVTEHRNCSANMNENWNYTSRSYKFTSSNKIQVTESNYLIDCE